MPEPATTPDDTTFCPLTEWETNCLGNILFGSVSEYGLRQVGRIVVDYADKGVYASLRFEVLEDNPGTQLRDFIEKMHAALLHFNSGGDAMTGLDGRICKIRVEVVRDGASQRFKVSDTALKALEFAVTILSCSSAKLESTVAA